MGQRPGAAVGGDLVLLHGLEEGRLGARGGPVDLVGQQHLGEDGAGAEGEVGGPLVEDARPGDVAGQDVRRELHPTELTPDGGGQAAGQQGLAHPRHVLEEDVAVAEDGRQYVVHHFGLAHHHLGHSRADGRQNGGRIGGCAVGTRRPPVGPPRCLLHVRSRCRRPCDRRVPVGRRRPTEGQPYAVVPETGRRAGAVGVGPAGRLAERLAGRTRSERWWGVRSRWTIADAAGRGLRR